MGHSETNTTTGCMSYVQSTPVMCRLCRLDDPLGQQFLWIAGSCQFPGLRLILCSEPGSKFSEGYYLDGPPTSFHDHHGGSRGREVPLGNVALQKWQCLHTYFECRLKRGAADQVALGWVKCLFRAPETHAQNTVLLGGICLIRKFNSFRNSAPMTRKNLTCIQLKKTS